MARFISARNTIERSFATCGEIPSSRSLDAHQSLVVLQAM
jgi:hypothetical protein